MESLASKFCMWCGRPLSKEAKYCAADGLPVEDQEIGRIKNCINCEYLLPQIAHYCNSCGYPQPDS